MSGRREQDDSRVDEEGTSGIHGRVQVGEIGNGVGEIGKEVGCDRRSSGG